MTLEPVPDQPERAPSPRLTGRGRTLYVAGAVALTEPGPAAAGPGSVSATAPATYSVRPGPVSRGDGSRSG